MAFFGAYSPRASSSSLPDLKKHDVFINFKGEDTYNNFTSHLHAALCRNQIETYIDNRLEKGDEVWPALVHAIKDTTVFLVIFSENYASSTRCLNELVEIIECKKSGQQYVIPVFYRVDPTHVQKQSGSYHTALTVHERGFKRYHDMVHKWKDALFEAANLAGFDSRAYRTESDLIESIIQIILRKLNHKYTNELRGSFIRDQNYVCIESLLKTQSREVQIIGIWGMGGIGKTTIAAAIFQEFSPKYESCCFLANVREELSRHGLNYIFNKLLCELLQEDVHVGTPKIISSTIMNRLRHKRVFIVLDDVNTSELLENLLGVGHDYLGVGSRVIVTTRDKHVFTSRAIIQIHEVKEMNNQSSLKLFSLNAFNKVHPENGYWELSKRAVAYAKGIPLALKVLGSFLHSKSENEWDSALAKLKKNPIADIQKVLRLSFDELDDTEKNIFLDIACFFKGQERDKVIVILNAFGFYADIGIRNLLDKALITITVTNRIQMHDLIQEMGQKIVCEESIENPGGRSRLWYSDEVCDILKNNKGTDAIESIFLDMTQTTDVHISSHAFRKMPNLRLLAFAGGIGYRGKRINNTLCLPTNLELPNNLRYIQWDGCPLKSLPSICWPNKLVELFMPYSNVEKLWDGVQNLPSLEIIDLRGSKRMIECPNFSGTPNLKEVWLNFCESLPHVHSSIFCLRKLEFLAVYGCKALTSLCSNNCSPSLHKVVAYACPNLQEFSVPILRDHSEIHLHLRSTALKQLPSSVLHLKHLRNFSFPISHSLVELPAKFANQIMLSDSSRHEYDTVVTLRTVLPSPVFQYVRLLKFDGCHSLTELPDNISLLSSLVKLSLHNTNVISLPESLKCLPGLKVLHVCHCEMLQLIPVFPPSVQSLRAWDCKSLKTVLSSRSEPPRKHEGTFVFLNCMNLDEDSYNTILKDAIARAELGVKALSATELENQKEACMDEDHDVINVGKICYFLPVRGSKLRDLFHDYSTQALVSIKLPQNFNLFGFVFYVVLSQAQSSNIDELEISFECECYLETSWGERIHIASSSLIKWYCEMTMGYQLNITSDHVLLWYDAQCCKQIMETIKGRKDIIDKRSPYNAKLTVQFCARLPNKEEAVIKECGIRWIYPNVEEGSGERKSKTSREVHELEAIAFQNREEGSESNEQEDSIPPTKKFKQSFLGTPSILEAEVEGMRKKLEELLHVRFDGDS